VLGVLVLTVGCGGGGDDVAKVTLADKSCLYSGAPTHAPGRFNIEAANTTSHFANFAVLELAQGSSIDDVRRYYRRAGAAHARGEKPPTPGDFFVAQNGAVSTAEPQATTVLPLNVLAGRFVIVCRELPSADTRRSSQQTLFPTATYVPAELEIR
jgi:hypothetical protein